MIYLLQFKSIIISWKALKSLSCPMYERNVIHKMKNNQTKKNVPCPYGPYILS